MINGRDFSENTISNNMNYYFTKIGIKYIDIPYK